LADGTVWDLARLRQEAVVGGVGADDLYGHNSADTLAGGADNDTLRGGLGADTYRFERGWGVDTVIENDSTPAVVDRIEFGAGIAQADVTMSRVGNNLELSIMGGTDRLIVQNHYSAAAHRVEQIRFADGGVLATPFREEAALLDAMAAFGAAGETADTAQWRSSGGGRLESLFAVAAV
jgi:Ca2+-binding RTX toxin-like protein